LYIPEVRSPSRKHVTAYAVLGLKSNAEGILSVAQFVKKNKPTYPKSKIVIASINFLTMSFLQVIG
jgi:hypothetical protein